MSCHLWLPPDPGAPAEDAFTVLAAAWLPGKHDLGQDSRTAVVLDRQGGGEVVRGFRRRS
jgi:hypothetical protein